MGNLGSVRRQLEECGADVLVSDDPRDLKKAERVVVPGVGSFVDGMTHLRQRGWVDELRTAALEDELPMLGICLGMQLFADEGVEGAGAEGLKLVPGKVVRLEPKVSEERVPHMGWNEVAWKADSPITNQIPDRSDFYFVHSYHFEVEYPAHVLATTPYCGNIVSAIQAGRMFGVQFHPEKSSRPGQRLLRNFLAI
jgi:glutamine amidotransferase